MHLQSFDIDKEMDVMNEWMRARELPELLPIHMPKIGFIVYENSLPVAVAFLRDCEGGFCMGDMIVSNPKCAGKLRHKALNMLFTECLRVAKAKGYFAILAFSLDARTIERLEKHGFQRSPFTYLTINL